MDNIFLSTSKRAKTFRKIPSKNRTDLQQHASEVMRDVVHVCHVTPYVFFRSVVMETDFLVVRQISNFRPIFLVRRPHYLVLVFHVVRHYFLFFLS